MVFMHTAFPVRNQKLWPVLAYTVAQHKLDRIVRWQFPVRIWEHHRFAAKHLRESGGLRFLLPAVIGHADIGGGLPFSPAVSATVTIL